MLFKRAARALLAGILAVALLSLTPAGLVAPPAHAEMDHGHGDSTASQDCLAGCRSGGSGVHIAVFNQPGTEEEQQNRDPVIQEEPYYTQFLKTYEPRKLAPQPAYSATILRPPDIVILYANYLS